MSFLSTMFIAILTGAVGLFVSGYVANLAVSWYRISSFEGGSGYFVVFTALGGGIAGAVIGVIASRIVAAGANPGFLKGLGFSLLTTLVLISAIGGVSRLKADVPPTLDGEELMLVVEARWPASRTESPANVPGVSFLQLGSSSNHVQRKSERGALWKEDARLVDGQWTVTGAAPIFTTRGLPTIDIALNDKEEEGFVIPMPSRPTQKQLEWSEWYPRDGKGGPPMPNVLNYRYRVQKRTLPLRTETVGPFQVDATIYYFSDDVFPGTTTRDGAAHFAVRYNGKPIQFAVDVNATPDKSGIVRSVAQLPGEKPALVVYVDHPVEHSFCALLTEEAGAMKETSIGACSNGIQAEELTTDDSRFRDTRRRTSPKGRVDRYAFRESRMLLIGNSVIDVPARIVHSYTATSPLGYIPSVPPLGVSPDNRSFVRFTNSAGANKEHSLVVTDFVANTVYEIPIDEARMRYGKFDDLTPSWLLHHFKWERKEGKDQLLVRPDLVPIPYRGTFTTDSSGHHTYEIPRANSVVRAALVAMIVKEFGGILNPIESEDEYEHSLVVESQKVKVTLGSDYGDCSVRLDYGETATDLVLRIGKRFDAILATGQRDGDFIRK